MTDAQGTYPQGWAWPGSSKKAHYFMQGDVRSLCMGWIYTGRREDTDHDSPDNCAACKKKRAKREAPRD